MVLSPGNPKFTGRIWDRQSYRVCAIHSHTERNIKKWVNVSRTLIPVSRKCQFYMQIVAFPRRGYSIGEIRCVLDKESVINNAAGFIICSFFSATKVGGAVTKICLCCTKKSQWNQAAYNTQAFLRNKIRSVTLLVVEFT